MNYNIPNLTKKDRIYIINFFYFNLVAFGLKEYAVTIEFLYKFNQLIL